MGSPPAPLSLPLEVLLLLSVPLLSDGLPWLLADGDGKPPELLLLLVPEAPELLEELELEEGDDEDDEGEEDEGVEGELDPDAPDDGELGEGGVGTEGVVGVLALGHPASNHVAANTTARRGNARWPAFVLMGNAALLNFFIAITHVPLVRAFVLLYGASRAA